VRFDHYLGLLLLYSRCRDFRCENARMGQSLCSGELWLFVQSWLVSFSFQRERIARNGKKRKRVKMLGRQMSLILLIGSSFQAVWSRFSRIMCGVAMDMSPLFPASWSLCKSSPSKTQQTYILTCHQELNQVVYSNQSSNFIVIIHF